VSTLAGLSSPFFFNFALVLDGYLEFDDADECTEATERDDELEESEE
jgi:hypothetical protein